MMQQPDPDQKGRYVYCQLCKRHVLRARYAEHYKDKHTKGDDRK